MGISGGEQIVKSGLSISLDAGDPFSYSGSGSTWTDMSGNGYNASLANNFTYSSGSRLGQGAIQFDQLDDYATFSPSAYPAGTGDFAIETWVYLISNLTYLGSFAAYSGYICAGNASGTLALYIQSSSNSTAVPSRIGFERMGGGVGAAVTGLTIPITTWHNICLTRISGTTYFYLNGNQIGTSAVLSGVSITAAPSAAILAQNTVFAGYFGTLPARISSFRVYANRGLSAAEVSQNYSALRERFGV
jgi:hypothetical protein